ncbi:MAG: hypothetical protein V4714_14355 [Bacteroidota bacterium]
MKILFKLAFSLLLITLLIVLIHINKALYYQPTIQTIEGSTINLDILHQLNFLKTTLHQGAGSDMQGLYPEGFIFMHALYGLSWCELATPLNKHTKLYKQAMEEIAWSLAQIDSEEGKQPFTQNLLPAYGAFYAGWSNYLLGKKLVLTDNAFRDSTEVRKFTEQCLQIAEAIRKTDNPYPESYSNAAWPADGVICIASLALYDQMYPYTFAPTIQHWLEKAKTHLDPATGLIPHSVQAQTGTTREGARGSSQSLINSFLPDIDPVFARQQFDQYKNLFLTERVGIPAIREYPKGKEGEADIDSGPVIWDIGGAATIVAIKTMNQYGEQQTAQAIRGGLEGFGFPVNSADTKQYLFGQLLIADAFIAWVSLEPLSKHPIQPATKLSPKWRLPFQLISLILMVLSLDCLVYLWKRRSESQLRAI